MIAAQIWKIFFPKKRMSFLSSWRSELFFSINRYRESEGESIQKHGNSHNDQPYYPQIKRDQPIDKSCDQFFISANVGEKSKHNKIQGNKNESGFFCSELVYQRKLDCGKNSNQ